MGLTHYSLFFPDRRDLSKDDFGIITDGAEAH